MLRQDILPFFITKNLSIDGVFFLLLLSSDKKMVNFSGRFTTREG